MLPGAFLKSGIEGWVKGQFPHFADLIFISIGLLPVKLCLLKPIQRLISAGNA